MKIPTLEELDLLIRERMKNRNPSVLNPPNFIHAAVLIPIFAEDNEIKFILTKRTKSLKKHKGEISFPGGRKDKEDKNLEETALRETEEEIGVNREKIEVVGRLDDLFTMTRYIITPFIGIIPEQVECQANIREVAEMLYVPMNIFLNENLFSEKAWPQNGYPFPVYYYYWNNYEIWGATAYIINQFAEIVFDFQPSKINFKRNDPSIFDRLID